MRNTDGQILHVLVLTMGCGARFDYGTTSYGVSPTGGMPMHLAAAGKKSLHSAAVDCPDCSYAASRQESGRLGRTVHVPVRCRVTAIEIQATE